jgi:hypothetical protein
MIELLVEEPRSSSTLQTAASKTLTAATEYSYNVILPDGYWHGMDLLSFPAANFSSRNGIKSIWVLMSNLIILFQNFHATSTSNFIAYSSFLPKITERRDTDSEIFR